LLIGSPLADQAAPGTIKRPLHFVQQNFFLLYFYVNQVHFREMPRIWKKPWNAGVLALWHMPLISRITSRRNWHPSCG